MVLPMQGTWTSLTSLSHSHSLIVFSLTRSSLRSQLHLPVTIQKLHVSSQDFCIILCSTVLSMSSLPLLFFATLLRTLICNSLDPWILKSLRLAHLSYRGRKKNFPEYLIGSSHERGHLHGGCVLCLLRTWQSLYLFQCNNFFSSKVT